MNGPELDGLLHPPVNDAIVRVGSWELAHLVGISLDTKQNLMNNYVVPTLVVAYGENQFRFAG